MQQINLTAQDFIIYLCIGLGLCLIYLYLLWQTIDVSKKSKHPHLILFLSSTLRIFLLIFVSLVLCQQDMARFLLIFSGFFITRYIVLRIIKSPVKAQIKENEIVHHTNHKKSTGKTKRKK